MSEPIFSAPTVPQPGTEIQPIGGSPSRLKQSVTGGLITGVKEIPLVGWLFERALLDSDLVTPEQFEGFARASESTPYGTGVKLAAEWLPQLLIGAPLWSGARKLGVAAFTKVASEIIGGEVGAQAIRAAALTGATAAQTTPVLARMMGGPLKKQLADMVVLTKGIPGEVTHIPAVMRAAEIIGGSAMFGTIEIGDALLHGKPLVESLREGGIAFALGAGTEAGFTVVGKAAFPSFRAIDQKLAAARELNNPNVQSFLSEQRTTVREEAVGALAKARGLSTEVKDLRAKTRYWDGKMHNVTNLQEAMEVFPKAEKMRTELLAAREALGRANIKLRTAQGNVTSLNRALALDGSQFQYLRSSPITSVEAKGAYEIMHRALLATAQSSEAIGKKLGVNAQRLMRLFQDAEVETSARGTHVLADIFKVGTAARETLGLKTTRFGNNTEFLIPYASAMRSSGSVGVRQVATNNGLTGQQADQLVDIFENGLGKNFAELHAALRKIGYEPATVSGVPLLLDDSLSETALHTRLVAFFQRTGRGFEDSTAAATRLVRRRHGEGFRGGKGGKDASNMFLGQDAINQEIDMSLVDALALGAPLIRDPLVAAQAYLSAGWKKVAYGARLGPKGEVERILKEAAYREGASQALVDEMANGAMLRNYGDQAARNYAAAIGNTQSASKMFFSFLPNASQLILTAVHNGVGNVIRFMAPGGRERTQLTKAISVNDAVTAVGINDSIISAFREIHLDPNFRTPLGWLADFVFSTSQFNRIEAWNRKTAAAAGLYDTMRTLTLMAEGRLRGQSFATASRRLQALNLDVAKVNLRLKGLVTKNGGDVDAALTSLFNENGGELLKKIAWRSANITQFIPTASRRPTMWNTPVGRILFQFKGFAFGNARFIRDQVLAEAGHGNVLPLATMLALAPPTGEAVASLQALRKGKSRPETGIDRVLADVGAIGGIGLVGDITRDIFGGRLLEGAVGPTFGDAAQLLESAADDNRRERLWNWFYKQPTVSALIGMGPLKPNTNIGALGLGLSILGAPLGALGQKTVQAFREHHSPKADDFETEAAAITLSDYGRTQP